MDLHGRQDLRSLALHRAAVQALRAHPERAQRALEVLTRWETTVDVHTRPLFDEWRRIIEGGHWDEAVAETDRGQQLRQASPLGFVLEPEVRDAILRQYRRDAAS